MSPAYQLQVRRLLLLAILLPTCAFAQSGVWGLRGITRRLLVRGSFVVDVDGRGVAVYDANTLRRLDAVETEGESVDGAFAGDTLIALTRGGFERFALGADGRLTRRGGQTISSVPGQAGLPVLH